MNDTDAIERERPAATARRLGYAGLVPMIVLSLWLYAVAPDHPWRGVTITALVTYGALMVSFLGGGRWGTGLSRKGDAGRRDLVVSILPLLAGWAALLTPAPYSFALLAVAFAAQGAWDSFAVDGAVVPAWYGGLRIRLTLLSVATMILAFCATA